MVEAGARAHDRAGLRGVRRGADRRGVDRAGAPRPPAGRAGGRGQGAAARTPSARSTPTSSCCTRPPASPGSASAASSSSTWWARSTSSRARCAASSTTASRPATPRSSGATSPATRAWRCPRSTGATPRRACSRWSASRGRCSGRSTSRRGPSDDRRRLANRITETWMQMVFVHGFFHADPHPANILVRDPDQHQPGRLRHDRAAQPARPRGGGAAAAGHPQPGTPSACRGACAPWASATRASRRSELGRPARGHPPALLGERRSARSTRARCCGRSSRPSTASTSPCRRGG